MSANHRFETLAEMLKHSRNLAAVCGCGHRGVLDGRQLARFFFVQRWSSRMHMVRDHLRCSICGARPERIGPTHAAADAPWRGPKSEADWRRLAARLRG